MNSMLQLFFMSYATMYCESKTVSALAKQLLADVHPPHVARVTGVLREAIQLNIKSTSCKMFSAQLMSSKNLSHVTRKWLEKLQYVEGNYFTELLPRNMPEFAKAFGCRKEDTMVADKPCKIW